MIFRVTRRSLAVAASTLTLASGAAQAAQAPQTTSTPDMPATITQFLDSASYAPSKYFNFPTEEQSHDIVGSAGGSSHSSITDQPGGGAAGSVAISALAQSLDGKAFADRSGDNHQVFYSQGAGILSYFITVTGPTSGAQNLLAPLHLVGAYALSADGSSADGLATAEVSYQLSGGAMIDSGSTYFYKGCRSTEACGVGTFFTNFTLAAYADAQDGNVARVDLEVVTHAFAQDSSHVFEHEGGDYSSEAFLDPKISIDADWLGANPGFQVNFSENVANGAGSIGGAPEPSSWVLMIAGCGLAGAALRRHRDDREHWDAVAQRHSTRHSPLRAS